MSNQVLSIVQSVFGDDPRKQSYGRKQISYDCPLCDGGKNSGNLEINYEMLVMKCWKCGEDSDGLKGSLRKLIKLYGNKRELKLYDDATEDYKCEFTKEYTFKTNYKPKIKLPEEYKRLSNINEDNKSGDYYKAFNYLLGRELTEEIIDKYDIGFSEEGRYTGRVIIPSYDKDGDLNYFVARSYINHKITYDNPIIPKKEIIINELQINWDSTIYLVEGIFDLLGLGIDNTIPLLGKVLHDKLYYELINKAKGYVVICLDPDAKISAYKIYKKLVHSLELKGKVRVIDLPLNMDISEIRQKYKEKGVLKCISKMRKLKLNDFIENNL